ncbi:hypothetical protein B0T22DRAFT_38039 [Podospora appendiculata]|uniref:Uncharacterized protein n=1 Tax=Podospora appendiculata TaxID=314037 RepID=A0AAE1CGB7_9PEZI|nr:hypothetical protein B0T22DRAFT_38039 [Podospora appendiculata]
MSTQLTAVMLAPIPTLQGEANLGAWKGAVYLHLEYYNLQDFIGNDETEPTADSPDYDVWKKQKLHAYSLIRSTIDPIVPKLLAAGLNFDDDRQFDPKALWNAVIEIVESGAALLARLDKMKTKNEELETGYDNLARQNSNLVSDKEILENKLAVQTAQLQKLKVENVRLRVMYETVLEDKLVENVKVARRAAMGMQAKKRNSPPA